MAIQGGRLPEKYVIAFSGDPAIDWIASAEMLEVKPDDEILDADERNADTDKRAREAYAERKAERSLPLTAKSGQAITEFVCRPLTKAEKGAIVGVGNSYLVALECYTLAVKDVRNYGREYKSAEDLADSVLLDIGSRIWAANSISEDEALF